MTTERSYEPFQIEERVLLAGYRLEGKSVRESARRPGRSASSVSRELRRNTVSDLGYGSTTVQRLTEHRRMESWPEAKLDPAGPLWPLMMAGLRERWSPEQIARTLRLEHLLEPEHRVSHETIYTMIDAHAKGELRKELIACLRQGRSTRKRRSAAEDRRGKLVDAISIHMHPPEVEDRLMPGHWEGNLIKGAGNRSAIAVMVERTTRLVLLAKMPNATAASALAAFTTKLRSIAEPILRKTLTYDRCRHAGLRSRGAGESGRAD